MDQCNSSVDSHTLQLMRVVEAIASEQHTQAERLLSDLLTALRGNDDPAAVGHYVFGAALARRLSPDVADDANLYLRRFEVPQIRLFNLLAHEVPQVGLATTIANRSIAKSLAGQSHATIIDVGIGTGRQITALLGEMRRDAQLPERVTLIGIEPSSDSLQRAEADLHDAAQTLGIELELHPFCASVESLAPEDWTRIAELCGTRPVINGSFAFHHIADVDGRDVRNDVLLRLRSLNPLAIVLSEPDVDHLEPSFTRRFTSCWSHFLTTFEVIDELPITRQEDKDALKVSFFGREIADILGNPEHKRSERHESTASWLRRLRETGFEPNLDIPLPPSGPVIAVTPRKGYATLDYRGRPLVAVLAAAPTPR